MLPSQNVESIAGGWAVDMARCRLFILVFSWTPLTQRIGGGGPPHPDIWRVRLWKGTPRQLSTCSLPPAPFRKGGSKAAVRRRLARQRKI